MPREPRPFGVGGPLPFATDTNSETRPPSAQEVAEFHRNADVDVSLHSIHHTLGGKPYQAASGAHNHDGENSPRLLEGYTINDGTVTEDIIACLVRLGATDLRT